MVLAYTTPPIFNKQARPSRCSFLERWGAEQGVNRVRASGSRLYIMNISCSKHSSEYHSITSIVFVSTTRFVYQPLSFIEAGLSFRVCPPWKQSDDFWFALKNDAFSRCCHSSCCWKNPRVNCCRSGNQVVPSLQIDNACISAQRYHTMQMSNLSVQELCTSIYHRTGSIRDFIKYHYLKYYVLLSHSLAPRQTLFTKHPVRTGVKRTQPERNVTPTGYNNKVEATSHSRYAVTGGLHTRSTFVCSDAWSA